MPPRPSLFRTIAITVVPEAEHLDEAGWREFDAIITTALARRPAALRRQLAVLLQVINVRAWLRYGRGLRALNAQQRYRVLHALERSRLTLLRRGVWGLRTLILMGYYARPEAAVELGYAADRRGWSALQRIGRSESSP